MTSGDKAVLQVNAAQPRHLHIGDKARCVVNLLGFKKIIGRGKRGSVLTQRSHERFRRIADGFFVINNRNQKLRHSVSGACRSAGARARLSPTDAISYVSDKGMIRSPKWDRNQMSFHILCRRIRYRAVLAGWCRLVQAGAGWVASYWPVLTFTSLCRVRRRTFG
jgi:hypothetical protein